MQLQFMVTKDVSLKKETEAWLKLSMRFVCCILGLLKPCDDTLCEEQIETLVVIYWKHSYSVSY